jgi:hypothetical protein
VYGVSTAVSDPKLILYRSKEGADTKLDENDNWGKNSATIASSYAPFGAFGFNAGSKDAALLVNLPEGNYTVHTSVASGGGGVVLVEVYTTND